MIDDANHYGMAYFVRYIIKQTTYYDHGTVCCSCKHQYVGKQNIAEPSL